MHSLCSLWSSLCVKLKIKKIYCDVFIRQSGRQEAVMVVIFECLKFLAGSPWRKTIERLVCTQKLCGAWKDWVNICLLQCPWEGHFDCNCFPVWFRTGVFEWLAGACRSWPGLWVSEDHRQKGYWRLVLRPLMGLCMSQRWGTTGKGRQIWCLTWVGEKTRMHLTQTAEFSYSQLSFGFMYSVSLISFCSIVLTLMDLPSSCCFSPWLQA